MARQALPRSLALLSCTPLMFAAFSARAACPAPPQMPDLSQGGLAGALQRATDRGFLWRIERDGRTSWLYGTMHLGKPDWMLPGPRTLRAVVQSDTVALELDLLDPATIAVFSAAPDAPSAARVLTAERRRRLDAQAAIACLPDGALRTMRPVLQVTTLSMLAARDQGLYGDFGTEAFLSGLARGRGKPVVALESAEGQLRAIAGTSEAEEGEQVDDALDELESGQAGRQANVLAETWATSDWPKLDSYLSWCDCVRTPADARMLKRLLDDRNPGLADGIEQLHARGQRVFGAVGALHMVGPRGLPKLMAERGFRVTAVLPAKP